jgi:hypothetical protein
MDLPNAAVRNCDFPLFHGRNLIERSRRWDAGEVKMSKCEITEGKSGDERKINK